MYGYVWLYRAIKGYVRLYRSIVGLCVGFVWLCAVYGFVGLYMALYGCVWLCSAMYGYVRLSRAV